MGGEEAASVGNPDPPPTEHYTCVACRGTVYTTTCATIIHQRTPRLLPAPTNTQLSRQPSSPRTPPSRPHRPPHRPHAVPVTSSASSSPLIRTCPASLSEKGTTGASSSSTTAAGGALSSAASSAASDGASVEHHRAHDAPGARTPIAARHTGAWVRAATSSRFIITEPRRRKGTSGQSLFTVFLIGLIGNRFGLA